MNVDTAISGDGIEAHIVDVKYNGNIVPPPTPQDLSWHSPAYYHYLLGRYSRLNTGFPQKEAMRTKAFCLSPWIPHDASPRTFAVIYSLASLASTVMNKGVREQLLLPLAEDLLWDNGGNLEQHCGEIWDNAMSSHLNHLGASPWNTTDGFGEAYCAAEGTHVLTPWDLLSGLEQWILDHPGITHNLSDLLLTLGSQHLSGGNDPVLSLHLRASGQMELLDMLRPWPILRDDVEDQREVLGQHYTSLGQYYGDHLVRTITALRSALNLAVIDAILRDGVPSPETLELWSPWGVETKEDFENLLERAKILQGVADKLREREDFSSLAASFAPHVSPDSLEALSLMAKEYNWDWAIAAFDWEAHAPIAEPVHPRRIFLSAPQGDLHGDGAMLP